MSLPFTEVLHPVQERPLRNRPEPEDEAEVDAEDEANSEAEGELDADQIAWQQEETAEEGHHFGEGRWGERRRAAYRLQQPAQASCAHASARE